MLITANLAFILTYWISCLPITLSLFLQLNKTFLSLHVRQWQEISFQNLFHFPCDSASQHVNVCIMKGTNPQSKQTNYTKFIALTII